MTALSRYTKGTVALQTVAEMFMLRVLAFTNSHMAPVTVAMDRKLAIDDGKKHHKARIGIENEMILTYEYRFETGTGIDDVAW